MKEVIAEVLALHQNLQADRSQSETFKAERDRLVQSREAITSRCQQLEVEAARLHQMLATRNSALSEELGLQAVYNKALAELSGRCLRHQLGSSKCLVYSSSCCLQKHMLRSSSCP